MSLLADAAEWFKARKAMVRGWYNDGRGRYAFRVDIEGQPFLVCAKKYLKDGQASFMAQKVVQRAVDMDAHLLLFAGGQRLVFDPATVQQQGDLVDPEVKNRANRGEQWVDVDAGLACSFRDWIDGYDQPVTDQASTDLDARETGDV